MFWDYFCLLYVHFLYCSIEFVTIEISLSYECRFISSHVFTWFPFESVEKDIEHKYREFYTCFCCCSSPRTTCETSYSCYLESSYSCFCSSYVRSDKNRSISVEIDRIFWILFLKKSNPVSSFFSCSTSAKFICFFSCVWICFTISCYRDTVYELSSYSCRSDTSSYSVLVLESDSISSPYIPWIISFFSVKSTRPYVLSYIVSIFEKNVVSIGRIEGITLYETCFYRWERDIWHIL